MSDIEQEMQDRFEEATAGPGIVHEPPPDTGAPEPAQPEPQDTQQDRLRDPNTGQFTTEERLYAGKFRTPEELEQDYQSRLGSMTNELGELRQKAQLADQYQQYYQQQQQAQQAAFNGGYSDEDLDKFDEFAVENPHRAVEGARQSSDPVLYERAMDTWYSIDPKAATRYEIAVGNGIAQQQIHAQYGQMIEPLQKQHEQQALTQSFLSVSQQYADFNQYGDQIVQVARDNPELLKALENPDPQAKERAFRTLYFAARGMAGQPGQQAAPAQQFAQADSTGLPAVFQAHVASPGSIPPGAGSGVSEETQHWRNLWQQGLDDS